MFDSIPNWIASPTAVQKMGEKAFAVSPVGAGPFMVVSDTLSNELVLKKNPTYWQTGRPYLDQLTFKSVGSDEAAYEAMLADEGQVYEDMSTPQLFNRRPRAHFEVENKLGTSPYDLQLNTAVAAVQQPQGAAGHLRGDQLRADPAAHVRQPVPGRPGLHRARRHLLRADGARLPGL